MSSPIIPWIGGKRRLAPELLPLFPDHTCYVELFAGAAALYFMKRPSQVEVINDINGDLVNLYRVVKHHLEEFVRQFKWCISSRQIYEWMKRTDPATLTLDERTAALANWEHIDSTFGRAAFRGLTSPLMSGWYQVPEMALTTGYPGPPKKIVG